MDTLIQQLGSTKQSWSFLRFPFTDVSQFTIRWVIVEGPQRMKLCREAPSCPLSPSPLPPRDFKPHCKDLV